MHQVDEMIKPDGMTVNWQSLAMLGALVISVTTFAIQMGAVQTQVSINTGRVKGFEDTLKILREKIARLDDVQKQIDAITEGIEKRRIEAATKADVAQLLTTTRLEFLSEVKRLDQWTTGQMTKSEFVAWKNERDSVIKIIEDRLNSLSTRLIGVEARR